MTVVNCRVFSDNKRTWWEYGTAVERRLKSTNQMLVDSHQGAKCYQVYILGNMHRCVSNCTTFSFSIHSTEMLSSSEHASLLQRSEILEECEQGRNRCYTLKSVEKIMKKVSTPATQITVSGRSKTGIKTEVQPDKKESKDHS